MNTTNLGDRDDLDMDGAADEATHQEQNQPPVSPLDTDAFPDYMSHTIGDNPETREDEFAIFSLKQQST